MDIFGFQFAYSPTALSGVGAFAIVAMIVATAVFAIAYLAGVVMTVHIVSIRERRREAAKKKRLRDLLAMKAAQDELDTELEREMHGIRPTSNHDDFAILHEQDEQEVRQTLEEPAQASDDVPMETQGSQVSAETVEPPDVESAESVPEEPMLPAMPAEDPAEPVAESVPETEPVTESAPVHAHEAPAFGFSFASEGSAEPEAVATPEPSSAPESSDTPAPFGFSFAPAEPTEALPEPEVAVAPEPDEAPAPFGFSFAVSEEPAPVAEEPVKAAKPEPEVEMSSFFKVG